MSLRKSKSTANSWGWLRDTDSTSSEDVPVNGASLPSCVLALHLHELIVSKPFVLVSDNGKRQIPINTFRLCLSAYALTRYSKTVRVLPAKKKKNSTSSARFDQTMQMMIRIYDKRYDKRHLVHVILYGYIDGEKRYALIADQVMDSIKLSSIRHVSDAVIFESSVDIVGKAILLLELIFVYGRHGYNYSSQLIFQNNSQILASVKNQTLFERVFPAHESITNNSGLLDPPEIELPAILKLSFDELIKHVANVKQHHSHGKLLRITNALSHNSKLSSMTAISEMYRSRKQRLEMLFDFINEGPYLPEQNINEPTAWRLVPWGIACWKRSLSGVALHGSILNMNEYHDIEAHVRHLQNSSPILRQLIQRQEHHASLVGDTIKLNMIKELVRRVIVLFFKSNRRSSQKTKPRERCG